MIVSVSRRTDIPALYPEWLQNRIRCGYAEVANPFNPKQLRRVDLRPAPRGTLEALVLWTRNPAPLLASLAEWESKEIRTLWLVTVTGYPARLEPSTPATDIVVAAVKALCAVVGRERIAWRYDPVFLAPQIGLDEAFHRSNFQRLAAELGPWVSRCIVSRFDDYAKTRKRLALAGAGSAPVEAYPALLQALARQAGTVGLAIQSCAEPTAELGMPAGACIDPLLLAQLWNISMHKLTDPGQRDGCRCAPSVDIGAYDTCTHGCLYCYATGTPERIARRLDKYRPDGARLV